VTVFGYQTKYIVYWFWISNKTKFLLEFELVLEIKLNRFWILDYWTFDKLELVLDTRQN